MRRHLLSLLNFLLLLPGLSSAVATANAQEVKPLVQNDAVQIAENFVVRNGYTDTTASSGTSLYLEPGENASDIKKILASRFNLIEKRAVIALIKSEGRTEFWSVQFLFTDDRKVEDGYDLGKEVRISLDGSKVWMNPKPIPVWASRAYGDCVVEDSLF